MGFYYTLRLVCEDRAVYKKVNEMKRFYNITQLEYLEYIQNGFIRIKDYERPTRSSSEKIYCESYDKPTIYDVLDAVNVYRVSRGFGNPFVRKIESYSFGSLTLEDVGYGYRIEVSDIRKVERLMKRLELEGLCPSLEGANVINSLKVNKF